MTETVSIEISEKSFKVLSHWASVSRTLTESMRLLENYQNIHHLLNDNLTDTIMDNIEELKDLIYPLDECNYAAKTKKFQLLQESKK